MSPQGREQFDRDCDSALSWIARLRSDTVSEQDQQSFALWLGESPAHQRAMDEMLDLWDDLGVLARLPRQESLPREAANNRRWYMGAAVAASLALALVFWPSVDNAPSAIEYQTALGEQRTVTLPDDSTVVLNTDSSISVSYSEDQRQVTLARGEAWFQVAPNRQRPFHVDAQDARITAIGTAFNIRIDGEATDVTVTEGVVRVSELGETGNRAPSTETLRQNEQLRAADAGWQLSRADDLSVTLAWQRGELVAREMPLADLVRQLERYQPTEIIIADPDLAVLTVSGVFQLDQPQAILSALEVSLGIQVDPVDDTTVRLLKADQYDITTPAWRPRPPHR